MSYNTEKTNSSKNQKSKFVRTNYNIRCAYCRVLEDGMAPQIMPTKNAIEYAQSKGLDLVEIGFDSANHCVNAKVIDYGKFCYEQKRKEKAAKRAARENTPDLKSIQFSLTTDENDMSRQLDHAKEFLSRGDRVKIAIRFRNRRESSNMSLAKDMMIRILDNFSEIGIIESTPALNGREFSCILRHA